MQKLYFMRHGLTQDNTDNVFSGPEIPLTDEGRAQVRAAAEAAKAAGITIDLIITSPLARAQETAKIVAEVLGVDNDHMEVSSFLRERQLGELEGKPYTFFFDGKRVYKDLDYVQGVETVAAMQDRARDELQAISERFENNILVVSHGGFGRAFIRAVRRVPYTDEFRDATPHDTPPNAQIIELI